MTDTPVLVALNYLARGWAPIPVEPCSKKPVGIGWQNQRLTADDIPSKFGPNANVGVLLGEPSGGLVDVDLDSPEAIALANRYLPPTAARFGKASTPECHRLYIAVGAKSDKCVVGGKTFVELRATQQTVFPGSVHVSGQPIQWAEDGEPAKVDALELAACVRKLGVVAAMVASGVDADIADRIADDTEALGHLGNEREETAPPPAGENRQAPRRTRRYGDSIADRYNREHMREWPNAGVGQCPICGHRGCFGKLGDTGKAFCFSASHADGGLRTPSGWVISPLDVDAHRAGVSISEQLRKTYGLALHASGASMGSSASPAELALKPFPWRTYSGKPEPPRWLFREFLELGTCAVLGAAPKTGKTWVTLDLAIALATGQPFLGFKPVTQGTTLFYSPEGSHRARHTRAWGLCVGRGLDPDVVLQSLVFLDARIDLNNAVEQHAERLAATIDALGACLVIIDPLVSAHIGLDENKPGDMMKVLSPLRDIIAVRPNCTLIVVHHTNKDAANRSRGNGLRGSSALYGWLDSLITISCDESDPASPRQLDGVHRDAATAEPVAYRLEHEPVEPDSELEWFRLALCDAAKRKPRDTQSFLAAEVLAALDHETPRTKNGVVKELGRGRQKVLKAFDQLLEGGEVVEVKGGFVKAVDVRGIVDQLAAGSSGSGNRAVPAEPPQLPKGSQVVPGSPPLGGTGNGTTWEEEPPTCLRLVPTPHRRIIEFKDLRCLPGGGRPASPSTRAHGSPQAAASEVGGG